MVFISSINQNIRVNFLKIELVTFDKHEIALFSKYPEPHVGVDDAGGSLLEYLKEDTSKINE